MIGWMLFAVHFPFVTDIVAWRPYTSLNEWLQVINFYMKLLIGRSKDDPKLPRVWAQNTFFYKKLSEEGYDKVKRWTRKVCRAHCDVGPVWDIIALIFLRIGSACQLKDVCVRCLKSWGIV